MRKISILLENPSKPANIGTVIRNIYAFDSGRLYIPKDAPFKKSAAACGTTNKVTIQKLENTQDFLKKTNMRKIGFIVAEHMQEYKPTPIIKFKFKNNDLLIFGTESNGLTKDTLNQCDALVTIPMLGHMACLNLATTTGIALYEVLRQKIEKGSITLKTSKKKKSVLKKAEEYANA